MQSIVAIVYMVFRMLYPQNGSFTTVAVFAVAALDALTRKTWILALQAQELREEVQLELKVAWKGREKPWFSSHSCRKTNENIIEYLYIACVHSLWTWFCRKPYRFNIYAVVFFRHMSPAFYPDKIRSPWGSVGG